MANLRSILHIGRSLLWLLGLVALYLLIAVVLFDDIEEDAYIYLRNALHIAQGHGYVFNIGGEHIETGSGLLWQALLVPIFWWFTDPVLPLKIVSLVLGCGCIVVYRAAAMRLTGSVSFASLATLMLVVSIPFYTWTQRGLETPLYLLCFFWLLYWSVHPHWQRYWALPMVLVLNLRPESLLITAPFLPFLWCERHHHRFFWRGLGIVLLAQCAVTAWRLWYFHDLLPHTFYFKFSPGQHWGVDALRVMFTYNGYPLLLLPVLLLLSRRAGWNARTALLLGITLAALCWVIIGEDNKPYGRTMGLFLACFYLLSFTALQRVLIGQWLRGMVILLCLVLAMYNLVLGRFHRVDRADISPFMQTTFNYLSQPAGRVRDTALHLIAGPDTTASIEPRETHSISLIRSNWYVTLGRFIALNYPVGSTVVFNQAGQGPWYAGDDKLFIDDLGLTDRNIGHWYFKQKAEQSVLLSKYAEILESTLHYFWPDEPLFVPRETLIDNIFARQPALVIVRERSEFATSPNFLLYWLLRDPRFAQRYRRHYVLNGQDTLYERADLYDVHATPLLPRGMQHLEVLTDASILPALRAP